MVDGKSERLSASEIWSIASPENELAATQCAAAWKTTELMKELEKHIMHGWNKQRSSCIVLQSIGVAGYSMST